MTKLVIYEFMEGFYFVMHHHISSWDWLSDTLGWWTINLNWNWSLETGSFLFIAIQNHRQDRWFLLCNATSDRHETGWVTQLKAVCMDLTVFHQSLVYCMLILSSYSWGGLKQCLDLQVQTCHYIQATNLILKSSWSSMPCDTICINKQQQISWCP